MTLPPLLRDRLSLPLIGSPMFIISQPDLVIAQCRSGIVGAFPSLNARPAGMFESWLQQLGEALGESDAPFAVNLIVHRTNSRLEEDLALCVRYRVPIVITSLGAREDVNDAIHSYGGIVLHDVINNVFARKAVEKGADGLIAVAAGAGGHAGTLSPFALIQEIRAWFDGPLALSGSIGAIVGQNWGAPRGPDGWPEAAHSWITPQGLAARIHWSAQVLPRLHRVRPEPREFLAAAFGDTASEPLKWAVPRAESVRDAIVIALSSADFNRR